jgi:two-component SAPR family response regulator
LPKKSLLTNVEKTITPKALPSTTAFSSSSVTVNTKKPTIIHDNDVFNIKEIEERFRSNSNPHLGLYIARYHYDHADYNEAYNYALKTNSISNTLEESWIVFSKSLVKLGRTDQAKKTLQLYISKSNSEEAKSLLNSIEHGEFK